MGCMRSSNSADGLNFHLRMMVQIMIAPPIQDAMTIMTVRVALPIPDDDDAELVLAAAADAVGDESPRELVKVTVVGPRLTAAVSLGAEVTARVSWVDEEVVDEEEVLEEVEVEEVEEVEVEVEVKLLAVVDNIDVLVVLDVVDVDVTPLVTTLLDVDVEVVDFPAAALVVTALALVDVLVEVSVTLPGS